VFRLFARVLVFQQHPSFFSCIMQLQRILFLVYLTELVLLMKFRLIIITLIDLGIALSRSNIQRRLKLLEIY
jgi:hypothetical protein